MRNADFRQVGTRGPSQLLGILLISGGLVWLGAALGLLTIPLQGALAAFLVVLGAGMIITRTSGVFLLIGITTVALLSLGSSRLDVQYRNFEGAGDRVIAPTDVSSLAPGYRMGAGTFTLDLREMEAPDGVTSVEISMGVGEMTVIVPPGVDIEGEARVVGGEVIALEETLGSGITVATDLRQPGSAPSTLRLDLSLVFGTIEIRRG